MLIVCARCIAHAICIARAISITRAISISLETIIKQLVLYTPHKPVAQQYLTSRVCDTNYQEHKIQEVWKHFYLIRCGENRGVSRAHTYHTKKGYRVYLCILLRNQNNNHGNNNALKSTTVADKQSHIK